MNRRLAGLERVERQREIDFRYVKFNLKSAEGQAGYRDYILAEIKAGRFDPKYPGSELNQQYRAQIYDARHYYEAEAIAYAICKMPPDSGTNFVPVMQSRPEKVELFISFSKAKRVKKELSPELANLQLPEGKKARLVRGKLVIK